jgi:hypothetical protein
LPTTTVSDTPFTEIVAVVSLGAGGGGGGGPGFDGVVEPPFVPPPLDELWFG